jgi:trk system potassium uptake protein TrkA
MGIEEYWIVDQVEIRMYVLIGGAGLIGLDLSQRLVALGHTVAVVDIDPAACRYAREQVGVMAFEGSAVSIETLLEAGIRRADALVAVLRDDPLNLAMTTLAKHYGVPRIVVRMRHRDFAEPYRLAGATYVVNAIDLAVSTMVNTIEYPEVESIMHFEQGQIEILKLFLPAQCDVVGRTVAEVAQDPQFPSGSLIIGYQPHPHMDLLIPNGSTVLAAESTILIATKPGAMHEMIDFMQKCR